MVKYGLSGSSTSGNLFLLYVHAVNHFDMNSVPRRLKVFSNGSAHLTVMITFYGTIFLVYATRKSQDLWKVSLQTTEMLLLHVVEQQLLSCTYHRWHKMLGNIGCVSKLLTKTTKGNMRLP